MRILAISGSVRRDSHNTQLLRAAASLLPAGVDLELYEGLKAVPVYDQDNDIEPAPAPVAELRAAIEEADAVLIATPEYNGSFPGQLKNALDWASRPVGQSSLKGKPVAVVGASTGMFGAVWAQADLRRVLKTIGATVVDGELPLMHAHERFDADGNLHDADVRDQLAEHVGALLDATSVPLAVAA
jgi:chromate reductase